MPREIVVDWTTESGPGKVSVFWFLTASDVDDQRQALSVMLGEIDSYLAGGGSWVIRQNGREVDDATGALTGAWSAGVGYGGIASAVGQPVADATQVLMQWDTGNIVGGRFLRGRTFIPLLAVSNVLDGNIRAAEQTAIANAGTGLINSLTGFGVWHRPTGGSGGVFLQADTCTVWRELAVLRRRRG